MSTEPAVHSHEAISDPRHARVAEVMLCGHFVQLSSELHTVAATATLEDAGRLMADQGVGHLIVVTAAGPVGLVAAADLREGVSP